MASAKETGNTDEKLEKFCDPCQIEDEHIIAISYCAECNEYLCKHCHKAHRRLAATREHIVIEQKDLPEKSFSNFSKSEMPEKCFAHEGQVIDHYCIFHEELCCSTCLSKSHQNCKDVRNIADYLKDADMEQEQRELERKMRELADDVSNTMYAVQTSLKAIELNHDAAQSEMLKLKNAAIEHIEEIYGTVNKQLNEVREEDIKKIIPYKNKCDAITFDLNAMESHIKSKMKCEKYQSFVAKKKAGFKIKSNREDLKEIRFKNSLKVRRYNFIPDAGVIKLKTQPSCFGTLNDQDDAIKTSSLVASLHARGADDKNICYITGLAVLKKDYIVLADHKNKSVKLVDVVEDRILSKVNFESAPWDVTAISDQQIAVTVPDDKFVYFLSVTENSTLEKLQNKQIKHEGNCYGITKGDDKIFVTVGGNGISPKLEQYGLDGKLLDSIELNGMNPQYVTMSADKSNIYAKKTLYMNGNIQQISVADKGKRERLVSCDSTQSGMAMDKTNVLYYHAGYRHICAVCTDYQLSEGDKQGVSAISNFRCDPKCLAFCDETNRLFAGSNDEIEVFYVV